MHTLKVSWFAKFMTMQEKHVLARKKFWGNHAIFRLFLWLTCMLKSEDPAGYNKTN